MKQLRVVSHSLVLATGMGLFSCALAIILVLTPAAASAQANLSRVKADIPFDFLMGPKPMPAGVYEIDVRSNDILLLRSAANKAGVFITTVPAETLQTPDTGRLVFNKYGNQYFLSELWMAGNRTGQQCLPGRAEKETLRSQNSTSTLVEVALLDDRSR